MSAEHEPAVIEGHAVEENGGEVARVEPTPAAAALALTPQVSASEPVARLDMIRAAQETAMMPNVDYGVIPGTEKPTLLKPGAEKLGVLFQLDIQLENAKTWGPGDHLTVESRATVFHAPTGARLGFGEGVCSTRERKYAYRKANRKCPKCGAEAIIKGKEEYGGGWTCWKKRDGCGAKFNDGDQSIEAQDAGHVDNPDLPDAWNTVVKMAEKRARVDAVLAVTGASALFTQDVEDFAPDAEPAAGGSGNGGGRKGADFRPVTDAQFFAVRRLLREKCGRPEAEAELMAAWAKANCSGGRGGTMSRTIERLGSDDDAARREAEEWLAGKALGDGADVPADTEGLDVASASQEGDAQTTFPPDDDEGDAVPGGGAYDPYT